MMKKLFALILALVMMTALSVPAFAAESPVKAEEMGDAAEITVTGIYKLVDGSTVYDVDIAWTSMEFTYTQTNTWVPSVNGGGSYRPTGEGQWSTEGGTVTVTNNSNADVAATLTFTTDVDGITGTIANNSFTLESAVGKAEAPSKIATLTIEGPFTIGQSGNTIGTITVKLAAG